MAVRFLEVIKPFCAVLPEVEKPQRRVSNPNPTRNFTKFLHFFGNRSNTDYECYRIAWLSWKILDSIPRKSVMDCNYIIHFPRLLSNSPFWNHEFWISWSLLLDSCYLGLKPWYLDGTRYLPNCHFRFDYATFGWCKNYWNWRYTKRTVRLQK